VNRCVVFLLVFFCAAAPAHADRILLFSDPGFSDSTLVDDAPRTATVYVVHTDFWGTGSRFRIAADPGFTGVWLGQASPYFTLGNSTTDVNIAYAACLQGPVLILTATYQLFGTSSACSGLRIAPANGQPCVIATSGGGCIDEVCVRDLGSLQVNCPVATEPSTWGRVKALYRN
jgi:hypothetical protein